MTLSILGLEIDARRKAYGYTCEDVGRQVGVASTTIVSIRHLEYTCEVDPETIAGLADFLGHPFTPHMVERLRRIPAPEEDEDADLLQREVLPVGEEETLPRFTHVGVKWAPTHEVTVGCKRCRYREPCQRDVLQGDFAWCEILTAVDILEPEIEAELIVKERFMSSLIKRVPPEKVLEHMINVSRIAGDLRASVGLPRGTVDAYCPVCGERFELDGSFVDVDDPAYTCWDCLQLPEEVALERLEAREEAR
jgi:transcriptional regulator with XRE-family HTH domain